MRKKLLFLLFILLLPLVCGEGNINFTIDGFDADGDEIYAYLLIKNGTIITVEQILDYKDEISSEGRRRIFYVNKYLGQGYYEYDYLGTNKEIKDSDYSKNITKFNFSHVNPQPEINIILDYYVRADDTLMLRQTITYRNIANTSFLSYPLTDLFGAVRNCVNESFYRLDGTYIENIEIKEGYRVIRTVDIPVNGEKGFYVECLVKGKINREGGDKRKIFMRFILEPSKSKNELTFLRIKGFITRFHIPRKSFLLKEIVFDTINPEIIPFDDGKYKILKFEPDIDYEKGFTSEIWIQYHYHLYIDEFLPWIIKLIVVTCLGAIILFCVRGLFKELRKALCDIFFRKDKNE